MGETEDANLAALADSWSFLDKELENFQRIVAELELRKYKKKSVHKVLFQNSFVPLIKTFQYIKTF